MKEEVKEDILEILAALNKFERKHGRFMNFKTKELKREFENALYLTMDSEEWDQRKREETYL